MRKCATPRHRGASLIVIALAGLAVAGCQSKGVLEPKDEVATLDESPIFSESEYGVPASPRVTNLKKVPKGGGREQVGKPYMVRGKWYYPKEEMGYVASGKASWYGSNFHGRLTANGEVYDMFHLSAAHPTFPLPSYARVTNKSNGRSVMVRVNDRGPYAHGRVVDLSERAAQVLDFRHHGVADVKVEYVGRAPLEGDDGPMLMATYRADGARAVDDGLPTGVMIASLERKAAPATMSSFAGSVPLPGVRRPTMVDNAPISPILPAASPAFAPTLPVNTPPMNAPLPMPRVSTLSYAPLTPSSGSVRALDALVAEPLPTTIVVGPVADQTLFVSVAAIASDIGTMQLTPSDRGASVTIELANGKDTDAALRALWAAGASDAFLVRD